MDKQMRIIHCADLHLDARMTANLPPEKGRERRKELYDTFFRMVQFADRNCVEAIIIAGDLFDKNHIAAASEEKIISVIREYSAIQFFYLRGNHDADLLFRKADAEIGNLHYFSSDGWNSFSLGQGKICVTGVELTETNNRRVFEELETDTDVYNIVVLHGQTEDTLAARKSEVRKKEAVIPLRSLQNKGIDYLALGHIHKKQTGRLDGRGIWCYPGCLEGRGFDECGLHGCILLDIDPDTHQTELTFVPLAKRNLYELPVEIASCSNSYEILAAVRAALDQNAYNEKDMVKVILKGEVDAACEIAEDFLTKQLEELFYYVGFENRTRVKVDYRDYATDPSLKGEFVRSVWKDELLSEEEKTQVIQLGIRMLMGVDGFED